MCNTHYGQYRRRSSALTESIEDWIAASKAAINTRQTPSGKCLIEGCSGEHKAKGLCSTHYEQYRRYDLKSAISVADWIAIDKTPVYSLCLYKGCNEHAKVKGLCKNHYYQHQDANKKHPISVEEWAEIGKVTSERGTCLVEGCSEFIVANGLCNRHYKRFSRHQSTKQTRSKDWGERERHQLYKAWCGVKTVHNIRLCEEWKDFWVFVKDVGEKPEGECWFTPIDNKKTVGPGNFYWKMIDTTSSGAERRAKLSVYGRAWRALHPEKAKEKDLRKKYNIGIDEWNRMYKDQKGVCKICGRPETKVHKRQGVKRSLSVDHCHDTGKIRGLLCTECNQAIGMLHHDISIIQKALDYCRTD